MQLIQQVPSHHLLGFVIHGILKSSKHPIHPYAIVAVVVTVCGVVNGVVASTHYRPYVGMDAVMNVRRPYRLHE